MGYMYLFDHYNCLLDRHCNDLVLKHRHLNHTIDGFYHFDDLFSDFIYDSVDLFHYYFLYNFLDDNFNCSDFSFFLLDNYRHFDSLRDVKDLSNDSLNWDDLIDIDWYFN